MTPEALLLLLVCARPKPAEIVLSCRTQEMYATSCAAGQDFYAAILAPDRVVAVVTCVPPIPKPPLRPVSPRPKQPTKEP